MKAQMRAKFKCDSVMHFIGAKEAALSVVLTGSEENKIFSKYTPSGKLIIRIDDETPASEFFYPGKEYYLNFEEA